MQEADKKTLKFDAGIYRASAVKKAAYRFSDRLHCHIKPDDRRDGLRVTIRPRMGGDVEFLAGEFCNEVLDQELRELVAEETRPIRDILMAQAFSAVSLVDEMGDDGDYLRRSKRHSRLEENISPGNAAANDRRRLSAKRENERGSQCGYALLPFQFGRLDGRRYLLTNFVGEHLGFASREELEDFIRHRLSKKSRTYRDLHSRHFLLRRRLRGGRRSSVGKVSHKTSVFGRFDQLVHVRYNVAVRPPLHVLPSRTTREKRRRLRHAARGRPSGRRVYVSQPLTAYQSRISGRRIVVELRSGAIRRRTGRGT